jgi:hypothetical protein
MSIFFTEVPKDVQNALNVRKSVYSKNNARDEADFAWLYRKVAYVNAFSVNNKNNKSASLTIPTQGGLGENSLYTTNDNAKFIPRPHIVSFKTYSDGDFGSLQKCELSFTVYTLTDLDAYQAFLDLGADITVNYGWNAGGAASGKAGKFEGVIYNFSYTVNSSGGFDCITYGIAKGSFVLGINITAGVEISNEAADALGNVIIANTLLEELQQLANRSAAYQRELDSNGIGYDEIQFSIDESNVNANAPQYPIKYYITLEKLIELININLFKAKTIFSTSGVPVDTTNINYVNQGGRATITTKVNPTPAQPRSANNNSTVSTTFYSPTVKEEDLLIICNSKYTRGLVPKLTQDLVSANPLQMIFPGYATYGTVTYFSNAQKYNDAFKNGDISKILLSIDWLKNLYNDIGIETQDRQKSADQSVAKFLSKIFNAILDNSGNRFKLSMSNDPENIDRFVIADVNYVDKTVTPYILTAVNNQSICRNISLSSKVPSAMASAAFISARSSLTTQSSVVGEVLNNVPSNPPPQKSIAALRQKLGTCINDLQVIPPTDSSTGNKVANSASDKVRRLQSALKDVFEATTSSQGTLNPQAGVSESPKNAIPFPIDFSATLDGIEGLKFGNTVTTNYLPAVYKNTRIAFTVTKVEHTIQNNDWITTLSTVCRVLPDENEIPYVYEYTGTAPAPAAVGTYGVTPTTVN